MSTIILEFDQVSAAYNGAIKALHGVSLTVRAGEIAALLGANGAGKTTLLKAASNLLQAERGRVTGGQIKYRGRDVTRDTPAQHIRNGLVPVLEGRRCFKTLTVEENLMTGPSDAGCAPTRLPRRWSRSMTCFPV